MTLEQDIREAVSLAVIQAIRKHFAIGPGGVEVAKNAARIGSDAAVRALQGQPDTMTNERLARMFHEAYERLAPSYGYKTRRASRRAFDAIPKNNRALMIAVSQEILCRCPRLKARDNHETSD